MSTNNDQIDFIKNHLNPENFHNREVVEETALVFVILVDSYVKMTDNETFYNLPYKDISVLVFNDQSIEIKSDTYDGFTTTVKDEIVRLYPSSSLLVGQEHVISCYEKFASHIELALIQKKFIISSAKSAEDLAKKATGIAKEASNTSFLSKQTAREAQSLSENAKLIAEKAQAISDNSLVSYITILGIFATIIITVFGGINLTNATVKLLQSEHDLPMMVFVVSFLMVGFISILIVLVTWISSLRKPTEYSSAVKWWILGGFSLLALISGLYVNNKIKVDTDCQIGYYTCLNMEDLKTPYLKDK